MPESRILPADNHVHSEWSWDADGASMEQTCEQAVALGIPAIAFTDHADFTDWTFPGEREETPWLRAISPHASSGELDVEGYWETLERCRSRFPTLRILSGLEVGEPHVFEEQARSILQARQYDRVLGAVHHIPEGGALAYAPALLTPDDADSVMIRYFAELLKLVDSGAEFSILAHIDYPKMKWPKAAKPYDATTYEDEYRQVLRALARSGRALEVNTSGPWPAPPVLRWWYAEGGGWVSFGSDAHKASHVARDFNSAVDMVEACGFRPGESSLDLWRR
jgi:histidinol-phosphatase (PHP family)